MAGSRRKFLRQLGDLTAAAAGLSILNTETFAMQSSKKLFFEISLAQWSLHNALFKNEFTNLDFPELSKKKFGISVVEYVNLFFMDKATDTSYLNELLQRCRDNGVKNHLIMIDSEGSLGDPGNNERMKAIDNHYKWIDAAKYLECATIRVNAIGPGSSEEVANASIESLSVLGEYAGKENINIVVENHGGYSSDGIWLQNVMRSVNRKNVGTLPDFGNFCIKRDGKGHWDGKCIEWYDRYKGVTEMMPFAKGVSAKSSNFDETGNCIETDYTKMMRIVKDAGFTGYVGIEYSGEKISEEEGILKTKTLLEKVGAEMS